MGGDESSEKRVKEETTSEFVVGDSSENHEQGSYLEPSVDSLELDIPNLETSLETKNQLIEQHRLVTTKLKGTLEVDDPQLEKQTIDLTTIEPATLEVSIGQITLETPFIDNPFDILVILDKLGPDLFNNTQDNRDTEDPTNLPLIRILKGLASGSRRKNSSTGSSSSSSSSEDTTEGTEGSDRSLDRDLGEERTRQRDSLEFPDPPPPPPIDSATTEVNLMANLNRPLNIAAYPIFYGLPITDLDMYVSRFLAVCSANRVLN